MICRARPKYLSNELLIQDRCKFSLYEHSTYKNKFFFNRGHLGLQFFLFNWNRFYKKQARVALQSFTCSCMYDAIEKSGNIACLYDVNMADCSIDFSLIKKEDNIDIIIVTHYQGIPNKSYQEIATYCQANDILLIEDTSHGSESCIGGIKIGTLGNISLESYAWDKPKTCLFGGAVVINKLEEDFLEYFSKEFEKLPCESDCIAKKNLKLLYFLMEYTKVDNYQERIDYSNFVKFPLLRYLYNRTLFSNKYYQYIFYLICKCLSVFSTKEVCSPTRLSPRMIDLVERQVVVASNKQFMKKKSFFELRNINGLFFFENTNLNSNIVWNRWCFIDKEMSGYIKTYFRNKNIQIGNFNWPICLHQIYDEVLKRCEYCSSFQNSEYLSKHIVNVPIWEETS